MSHPSGSPPPPPSVTVADVPADDSATTAHQRAPPLDQRTTTTSSQNSSHFNRQHCTKPPPVPGDAFVAEEAEEKRAARERREAEKEEAKTALPKKKTIWRKLANLILDNGLIELRWISSKMTFQAWKPVIRCALAAWIAMLWLLIGPTLKVIGQASFFTLVVALITPPDKPFVQTLEVHMYSLIFVGGAWLWVVIAAAIVAAIRVEKIPQAEVSQALVFSGAYLEPRVTIVCAVFLAVGSGFFCWLKCKTAPSAITFPTVLACILLDVSFTLLPLVPYDNYRSGELFYIPMCIQVGANLLIAFTVFPQSVSAVYLSAFTSVIDPIHELVDALSIKFRDASEGELSLNEWFDLGEVVASKRLQAQTGGLALLLANRDSLTVDLSWGRLGKDDLHELGTSAKDIVLRAGGISFFFEVVRSALRHDHLDSDAFKIRSLHGDVYADSDNFSTRPSSTRPSSPQGTPPGTPPLRSSADLPTMLVTQPTHTEHELSRRVRIALGTPDDEDGARTPSSMAMPDRSNHDRERENDRDWERSNGRSENRDRPRHVHHHPTAHIGHERSQSPSRLRVQKMLRKSKSGTPKNSLHGHSGSHVSLLERLRKIQEPVGLFESQRYMDVEHSFSNEELEHIQLELLLLAKSSIPLIDAVRDALKHASEWSMRLNKDRSFYKANKAMRGEDFKRANARVVELLGKEIDAYRSSGRMTVLEPYKHLFDPSHPVPDGEELKKVPYRDLFWCYLFQFHILALARDIHTLVKAQAELEIKRPQKRIWWPRISLSVPRYFHASTEQNEDPDGEDEAGLDSDPERIPGFRARDDSAVGGTTSRDPDALNPSTPGLALLSRINHSFSFLTSNQFFFALKAGVLSVLVATPAWTPSTAAIFYDNRGLWALVMAQLTLAFFTGETAMAWIGRVTGTLAGCIVGLLIWTIGAGGSGRATPWGMGATCAVAFPMVLFARLYYPGPPLTRIIFTISVGLVVGYGWQNAHGIRLTNAGWGFDVAWRRFLLVLIGITAAWLWSFVPPISSGKKSIRYSYARLIATLGDGICAVLSQADLETPDEDERRRIESNIISMKRKLTSNSARHQSMRYELSFAGPWPLERYEALRKVLTELVSLLAQFQFILSTMDRPWRRALLKRTRLMDSRFLGDVLAVISLCSTGLRSSSPLPQITPCPLIERFLERRHGLRIDPDLEDLGDDEEKPQGLPTHVTADVLESEAYLRFACCSSTAYAIVSRLDRLMLISKTLLGETYHIDGIRAGSVAV